LNSIQPNIEFQLYFQRRASTANVVGAAWQEAERALIAGTMRMPGIQLRCFQVFPLRRRLTSGRVSAMDIELRGKVG